MSIIRDEVHVPPRDKDPYDGRSWGKYVYGAWLEEDAKTPGEFYISFPYWRNGRFAGQYTLRAEPAVVRELFEQIEAKGWLQK